MRIAIVGAGIAGLTCAHLLHPLHEITVFEAGDYAGGHTNTLEVAHEGRGVVVDTGFIVFNERNYPGFCRLLKRLGVASQETTMSFSVRDDAEDFEFGGSSLSGIFAQRRNLLSPEFYGLLADIMRLGRIGKRMLREAPEEATLGQVFASEGFSRALLERYLVPMGAAIWSAPTAAVLDMPARFFLRFFDNHGMLNLRERPQWRTVRGGSRTYVEALVAPMRERVRLNAPVARVERPADGGVIVTPAGGAAERFDEVILALHSDQALAVLADASEEERAVLSAMPYQANEAVLHCDESLLPRRRAAWSAWNARLGLDAKAPVAVTYDMTILQSLDTRRHLCVTLNDTARINPDLVYRTMRYHHPVYTVEGERARARWAEVSGVRCTSYCGAYWGNGFHEDGVASALRVCQRWGAAL